MDADPDQQALGADQDPDPMLKQIGNKKFEVFLRSEPFCSGLSII
jgi:hypothetical protein